MGVILQFATAKNEVFCLPANLIRFIGKNKYGSRIYVENDVYYDVVNEYEAVLEVLSQNNFTIISVPITIV